MGLTRKDASKKPKFFYKDPTEEAISQYGLGNAELFQREQARKISIRVYAGLSVIFGGTVKTIIDARTNSAFSYIDAAADYVGSLIINGVILVFVEKFNNLNFKDEQAVARLEQARENELTAQNTALTATIQEAGLPLPDEHTGL